MAEKDMGDFSSFQMAMEAILTNRKIKSYDTPWWGDKETESANMSNRGYIIGFKDVVSNV